MKKYEDEDEDEHEYTEDQLALAEALTNWFVSQGVTKADGVMVMLGVAASTIALQAPSFKDLKEAIHMLQGKILSNALEIYLRAHGHIK